MMGVDLRQVVAGVLTLTMFVMLIHMIKRDHFDAVDVRNSGPVFFIAVSDITHTTSFCMVL